jgi:hypothetical protein
MSVVPVVLLCCTCCTCLLYLYLSAVGRQLFCLLGALSLPVRGEGEPLRRGGPVQQIDRGKTDRYVCSKRCRVSKQVLVQEKDIGTADGYRYSRQVQQAGTGTAKRYR